MNAARLRSLAAIASLLSAASVVPVPAQSQQGGELVFARIHSNLPLYTFDWEELWPRSFQSGDSFGCQSPVPFGDWRFIPVESGDEEEHWERYSNYGVFHCAAIIQTATDRSGLDASEGQHGFYVRLGGARLAQDEWELWAIQKGTLPGSEYILLARPAAQGGAIVSFRVLQQRCPRGRLLEAQGMDIWRTRYCSINSRGELLALARRMLPLRPRGTIERVRVAEGSTPPD